MRYNEAFWEINPMHCSLMFDQITAFFDNEIYLKFQ